MSAMLLIIAPAAKNDINDIYHFGLDNWGQSQSEKYLDEIKNKLWLLTTQPLIGKERPELFQNIRSLPLASHILFYKVTTESIDLIRILHKRQDPLNHLK